MIAKDFRNYFICNVWNPLFSTLAGMESEKESMMASYDAYGAYDYPDDISYFQDW